MGSQVWCLLPYHFADLDRLLFEQMIRDTFDAYPESVEVIVLEAPPVESDDLGFFE